MLMITPAGMAPDTTDTSFMPSRAAYVPPSYACTPGYCLQQLQSLLNLAVAANLPAGQSFPMVTPDGNIGSDTVNAILFMANTGIPQFALLDVQVTPSWIAANAPALVQSYASYLGVDPTSLIAAPPPIVAPIYQPPPSPPSDQLPPPPPSSDQPFTLCPDGTHVSDPNQCLMPSDQPLPPPPTPFPLTPGIAPELTWWDSTTQFVSDWRWPLGIGAALLVGASVIGGAIGRRK